jgi:hypothetical protein
MFEPPMQPSPVTTLNRAVSPPGPQKGINLCFVQRNQTVTMCLEPMAEGDDEVQLVPRAVATIALCQQVGGKAVNIISKQAESGLLKIPRG